MKFSRDAVAAEKHSTTWLIINIWYDLSRGIMWQTVEADTRPHIWPVHISYVRAT